MVVPAQAGVIRPATTAAIAAASSTRVSGGDPEEMSMTVEDHA